MLKMTEAFSYAREYCEVGLCVKASNLEARLAPARLDDQPTDQVKEILI